MNTVEERATSYASRYDYKGNLLSIDGDIKNAYMQGATDQCKIDEKEFLSKANDWFHNVGPFVYPEDDETWESFKRFIKKGNYIQLDPNI